MLFWKSASLQRIWRALQRAACGPYLTWQSLLSTGGCCTCEAHPAPTGSRSAALNQKTQSALKCPYLHIQSPSGKMHSLRAHTASPTGVRQMYVYLYLLSELQHISPEVMFNLDLLWLLCCCDTAGWCTHVLMTTDFLFFAGCSIITIQGR